MSSVLGKAIGARLATPSIFTRTFMLGIVGSLAGYLASWENADRVRDNYIEKNRDSGDTFDFIIVGGGTAGAILANRLSLSYKTLLLEAGGEPHPFQNVPLLSNYLMNYAELDWRHVTMPQKQGFLGSIQSRASISQGRGLGGTTNLGFMMYLHGHHHDYDNWADTLQDESWSYNSVQKYFKSLEQYEGPWNKKNHGQSGPMMIKRSSYTGLGKQFCLAAQESGYEQLDLNDVFTEGCDILTYPSRKGYRDSVFSSFYKPAKDRQSLITHKFAHVNKILIRGSNSSAYAVEYDRHGKSHIAYSRKEIILTAGAIQTPKILMLSGIGPKTELSALGIPVIADLPVGSNLMDHPSVMLGPFFVDRGKSLDIDRDVSAGAVLNLARDSGPLTTTGYQAAAVISSGLEKLHGSRNWPDLQLTMYGLSVQKSVEEDLSHAFKLKKDLLKDYLEHAKGHDSLSILVSVGRPKSSGAVKLLNKNPYAPLIINPNYFEKIYDVVVMVDGVKKALKLVENSTVFRDELQTTFTQKVLPGCEKFRFRSDAYFECYARTMSISLGNVAGTAAMGTVLNSKMEVKGVQGLRVMDASVMPSIVSTSTAAAVMMIAEKGADLLLTQYQGNKNEQLNLVGNKPLPVINPAMLSTKAILEAAIKFSSAGKTPPPVKQFNMADLQKLTKSVGNLKALLDPVKAAGTQPPPKKDVYTGSFSLGNDTEKKPVTVTASPFDAMRTLAPILKSQFGGLYQNFFAEPEGESSISAPVKTNPGGKGSDIISKLVGTIKLPILSRNLTSIKNHLDPLKIIQGMLDKNLKDLEALENIEGVKGLTRGQEEDAALKNVTLEDIFGMHEGGQDELEDYDSVELFNITSTEPITETDSNATTKRPVDYSFQVLPVPLTKSKSVETSTAESINKPVIIKPQTFTKPVYQKPTTTVETVPLKVEIENVPISYPAKLTTSTSAPVIVKSISYEVKPTIIAAQYTTTTSPRPPVQSLGIDLKKLKNLEALALIQHDTLAKLRNKQAPKPKPRPTSIFSQLSALRNPALPSFADPIIPEGEYVPALEMLPPAIDGRFPPPEYFKQPQPSPPRPPSFHPLYDQLMKKLPPHYNRHIPTNIRGPLRNQPQINNSPPADVSDLKYAVHSIMNAKYTHPTINPFLDLVKPPKKEEETDVLKALQLRANVDNLIKVPLTYFRPSPVPITERPSPSPPIPILNLEELQKDEGIFAPLKDALEPLTRLMKAPLDFFPNPFKSSESSSQTSGLISSLFPSIFSQRTGPMSIEPEIHPPPQENPQPHPEAINQNYLASVVIPRLLMNYPKSKPDITPDEFISALNNVTHVIPKPFVLQPNKPLNINLKSESEKEEPKMKLLDDSISDILSHLNNHHFATLSGNSEAEREINLSPTEGINSANEILNIDYARAPTIKTIEVATPKIKLIPPVEFHKSLWAREPSIPSKSLHFKIKIV